MFRTTVRRDGKNPLTGRKQYRVVSCNVIATDNDSPRVMMDGRHCILLTRTFRQPNTFINPAKALNI